MEFGGIAQLGERLPCKQEVNGSIPFVSTIKHTANWRYLGASFVNKTLGCQHKRGCGKIFFAAKAARKKFTKRVLQETHGLFLEN